MVLRTNFVFFITILLAACGGGGSSSAPSSSSPPSPPVTAPSGFQTLEEFELQNGVVPAQAAISTTEAALQLATMAATHVRQVANGRVLINCENSGNALTELSTANLQIGTIIEISFENCFDKYLNDLAEGQYKVEILDFDEEEFESVRFKMELEGISLPTGDTPLTLHGQLEVTSTISFEQNALQVKSVEGSNVEIRIVNQQVGEVISQIDIKKTIDYSQARYQIEGTISVDSALAGLSYQGRFSTPLSGYLNTLPDQGEMLIEGGPSDLILAATTSETGNYEVQVDLGGNGTFEVAPNASEFWLSLLEGVAFYDDRTAGNNSLNIVARTSPTFELLELSGYLSKERSGEYLISRNQKLRFVFSKPLVDSPSKPPLFRANGGTETAPDFEINGAIITVSPGTSVNELIRYILSMTVEDFSGTSDVVSISTNIIKNVTSEVNASLFAVEKSTFELDGVSLTESLFGEVETYEWTQLSGPTLLFEPTQPVLSVAIPEINEHFQEVSMLLSVSDSLGESSSTEFRFLIVEENYNRTLMYVPFWDNVENRVYVAKSIDVFFTESEQSIVFDYDAGEIALSPLKYVSAYIGSTIPDGDWFSTSGNLFSDISYILLRPGEDECEEFPNLGPLAPNRFHRIISKGLKRNESGDITAANIQVSRYCRNLNQVRSEFGVFSPPGTFTAEHPGFVFANSTSPLFVEENKSLDIQSDRPDLITIQDNKVEAVSATGENTKISLIISDPESDFQHQESIELDFISDLTQKAFVYFEKTGKRRGDDRPVGGFRFYRLEEPGYFTFEPANNIADVDVRGHDQEHSFRLQIGFPTAGLVLNQRVDGARDLSDDANFISIAYRSTTCSQSGWYEVLEYEVDAQQEVTALAVDFHQSCGFPNTFNRGAVRFNSTIPVDFSKFPQP